MLTLRISLGLYIPIRWYWIIFPYFELLIRVNEHYFCHDLQHTSEVFIAADASAGVDVYSAMDVEIFAHRKQRCSRLWHLTLRITSHMFGSCIVLSTKCFCDLKIIGGSIFLFADCVLSKFVSNITWLSFSCCYIFTICVISVNKYLSQFSIFVWSEGRDGRQLFNIFYCLHFPKRPIFFLLGEPTCTVTRLYNVTNWILVCSPSMSCPCVHIIYFCD